MSIPENIKDFSQEPFSIKDLKISRHDVIKYEHIKGKNIGIVLEKIFESVMSGHIKNERFDLLDELMDIQKVMVNDEKTNVIIK